MTMRYVLKTLRISYHVRTEPEAISLHPKAFEFFSLHGIHWIIFNMGCSHKTSHDLPEFIHDVVRMKSVHDFSAIIFDLNFITFLNNIISEFLYCLLYNPQLFRVTFTTTLIIYDTNWSNCIKCLLSYNQLFLSSRWSKNSNLIIQFHSFFLSSIFLAWQLINQKES